MAPRNSPNLALVFDREKQKGNANRATLAVDRGQRDFVVMENEMHTAA